AESSYYTTLPYPDPAGRRGWDWQIRARSYRCLVEEVIRPLAIAATNSTSPAAAAGSGRKPRILRVLDLGAGNCWLSFRLAQAFRERFGFASNSLPMRNFLTWDDLGALGRSLGLRWRHFRPSYGFRWRLRPWRAALRRSRQPATFTVSVATRI